LPQDADKKNALNADGRGRRRIKADKEKTLNADWRG
jgi:hypothetical protein